MTVRLGGETPQQEYLLSVIDSDDDKLLDNAPLQAVNLQSAWERAIVIAFRACQGSGAVPTNITLVKRRAVVPAKLVAE
jgi:hypothetical protein